MTIPLIDTILVANTRPLLHEVTAAYFACEATGDWQGFVLFYNRWAEASDRPIAETLEQAQTFALAGAAFGHTFLSDPLTRHLLEDHSLGG